MIEFIKSNKNKIIELLVIFLITLLFNLFHNEITNDEVWNFGFAYNIANGLIPYKDFNMIITPLFPILNAIFMFALGKNIVVMHIINAIICTLIFNYIKKYNNRSYYIVYAILLFFSLPNYNIMCILWLYILISFEDKNKNDYLIGIVLGLTFLTKQNVGIFLCIPTLLKKDIKKIFKRIIGFIIPNMIILLYLIYTNSLYQFIDYTIFGMNDFANKNLNYNTYAVGLLIISTIYLIHEYIKIKDKKILYFILFLIISIPIIDPYHVVISLIPTFNYFFNNIKLNKKIITCSFTIFITIIFIYNLYEYHNKNYTFINDSNMYKYRKFNNDDLKKIITVSKYLNKYYDNNTYIIDATAYLIKLEANIQINKYDMLNDGNLGKKGINGITDELDTICKSNKCTFLIYKDPDLANKMNQYRRGIYDYVLSNYQETDNIEGLSVYKNY